MIMQNFLAQRAGMPAPGGMGPGPGGLPRPQMPVQGMPARPVMPMQPGGPQSMLARPITPMQPAPGMPGAPAGVQAPAPQNFLRQRMGMM
jgi:U1 small nuclear ribonucleoprotein C